MATDVERLLVQLSADFRSLEKGFARATSTTNKRSREMEARLNKMAQNMQTSFEKAAVSKIVERDMAKVAAAMSDAERQVSGSLTSMKSLVGGAASLFAARELVTMADTWSDLSARVGIAVGEMSKAPDVMERIYDMAQRTYSSLEQTAESYIANSTALRELGYSTDEQLNYTEALNNALVVSGAKAERAASVSNALSKAMAGGKLSGDELNTVITTGGRVAEVLAEELGVGVNQLRALGSQGKITSQVIYNSLTKRLEGLTEQAEAMPATIADGFQLIRNSALKSVGALDQTGKVSEKLSGILGGVAKNMDTVATAGIAMAAVFGARQIGAATSSLGNYAKTSLATATAARAVAVEEHALAAARLRSAEAAMAAVRANGLVSASLRNVSRELLAARMAMSAANAQLAATGPIATASSVAVRGLSLALNALGGPVGVGLLALTGIMYLMSVRSQEAEDRANKYADAIRKAGEDTDYAGLGIEKTAEKLFKLARGLTEAQKAVELQNATDRMNAAFGDLAIRIGALEAVLKRISPTSAQELKKVYDDFVNGKISVEDFHRALDSLSNTTPDLSGAFAEIQGIGSQAAAARGEINALKAAVADLGGKGGRLGKETPAEKEEREAGVRKSQVNFEGRFSGFEDVKKQLDSQQKEIEKASKGKKEPKERINEYERLTQSITDRTAATVAETEAQRQINPLIEDYDFAIEKARATQELLNAAQKAGVAITPELRAQIAQTAEQWALATAEANKLAEAQGELRQKAEEWRDAEKDALGGLVSDLAAGKSGAEALADALQKVLDKLLSFAFDGLFDGIFGKTGSIFGGLFRKDGGPVKAATGGLIRGPGGPRTDSIPAMLSNGEYVINAKATKQNRALLEAINSGRSLALADGGMASLKAPSMPTLQAPQRPSAAGPMRVDVVTRFENDGNFHSYVENVSQNASTRTVKAYDKSGPMRFARDSKQANRRGLVR